MQEPISRDGRAWNWTCGRSIFLKTLFTSSLVLTALSLKPIQGVHAEEFVQSMVAHVLTVQDGDTLEIEDEVGTSHWVRLLHIDAPEKSQPAGPGSTQALAAKVAGETIQIRFSEYDRYGRILGEVLVDGRDINRELVTEGWAWVYRHYCEDPAFLAEENEARSKGENLWAQPLPEPPWEWRHRQRISHVVRSEVEHL